VTPFLVTVLFIQLSSTAAGPWQLRYDFKHQPYNKTIFAYWNIFSPELPISLENILDEKFFCKTT